jgi:macrolide-specific efflux system membrane fusion protein
MLQIDLAGAAEPIEVDSVLIRLVEQVDVPAKEPGVLATLNVREGQLVKEGEILAEIENDQARLARAKAKLEFEIAQRRASNDVSVRYAKKALQVAQAELKRAKESVEQFDKSVSKTELDRLELTVQRGALEIEQAEQEMEIEKYTQYLKRNEVDLADVNLERLRIAAPIDGVVDQISRRQGEWVEPGRKVLRILRVDKLRAEGFVSADELGDDLAGRAVELTVDLPRQKNAKFAGRLVFVSTEIDPVNRQVRVWAEVENRDLQLRPGQRAKMVIQP